MFLKVGKDFYRDIFKISWPLTIRMMVWWGFSVVTCVLLSYSGGEHSISTFSVGADFFTPFVHLVEGLSIGGGIFIAQYYGKKDKIGVRRSFGVLFIVSFVLSLIAMILALCIPRVILQILTSDTRLVEAGVYYLRIICFSYCLDSFIKNLEYLLQNTYATDIIYVPAVICYIIRSILVALGIRGHFGHAFVGANAVALSTVIVKVVNISLLLILMYRKKHMAICRLSKYRGISSKLFWKIGKISSPVMLSEWFNAFVLAGYVMVYGHMTPGTLAQKAIIYAIFDTFALSSFSGFVKAVSTKIGATIGKGDEKKAVQYSNAALFLGTVIIILAGIILQIMRPYFLGLLDISSESKLEISKCLNVLCVGWIFRAAGETCRRGMLTGGGDTLFCTLVENISNFVLGLGSAFVMGIIYKLPLHIVFIAVYISEPVKLIFYLFRIKSKKWINNLT